MGRTVTLVVLDTDSRLLGALPSIESEERWWPETIAAVTDARERYGLELQVLRVLHGSTTPPGGDVTYVAQLLAPDLVRPATHDPRMFPDPTPYTFVPSIGPAPDADAGSATHWAPADQTPAGSGVQPSGPTHAFQGYDAADDARRAPYARPGGPAETLRWAYDQVERLGRGPVAGQTQQRTWNLSALWRLETTGGPLWIKQVPWFFRSEAAVLTWLGNTTYADNFPILLAHADGRMLLEHIPGRDLFHAGVEVRDRISADLHPAQLLSSSTVDSLIAAGVPDRRQPRLLSILAGVVEDSGTDDPRLHAFVDRLPERLAAIEACGLPDTLVHGDLHPGNVRGGDGLVNVVIDWGDAFVGHPGFDIIRLAEGTSDDDTATLVSAWADRWRASVPGCDPLRAVELLRPCAALRNAAMYAQILAAIEPSEYPYHADDVPFWLARTAEYAAEAV